MLNSTRAEMFRRQYAAGAVSMAGMLARAEASGRNVGGYTVDQLRALVADYKRLAGLSDAAMVAHLSGAADRMASRRAEIGARG